MKSEICFPDFCRVFLCFVPILTEVTTYLIFLANEISIKHDANTGAIIHRAMSVALKTVKHSKMTATKYPKGFFQSNGNLEFKIECMRLLEIQVSNLPHWIW